MGLLPQGEKYPGMGNIFYFSDDTAERLMRIQSLKKDLGIPLRVIKKCLLYLLEDQPWDVTLARKQPSALDLTVWWAGQMATLRLLRKPSVDQSDLVTLFGRVKAMFEAFGVGRLDAQAEPDSSSAGG
jgi:DNA-binding transcriptional MerR regulator